MVITLTVLTDIYSKEDKKGNQKILKKDQEYKKQFETNEIRAEHYLNTRGNPSKRTCLIKEGDTYYKIKQSFEEIEKLTQPIKIQGFKLKNKRKNERRKSK